jgi:hypothetical protein
LFDFGQPDPADGRFGSRWSLWPGDLRRGAWPHHSEQLRGWSSLAMPKKQTHSVRESEKERGSYFFWGVYE